MSTGRDLPRKPLHINGVGILEARCSFSRTNGVKTKKPRAVKHTTVVKFWKLLNTNWLPVNTNFWLASVGEPYMLTICSFIPYLFMKNSRPHPRKYISILFVNKHFSVQSMLFSVNNVASQRVSTVWIPIIHLRLLALKSFPSHKGPLGGADLRFNSPQPDTSRSCKSTDMGLVVTWGDCLGSQLAPVPIYCLVNRGTRVWTTCPRLSVKRRGWESNLRPHGYRSDVQPLRYHASLIQAEITKNSELRQRAVADDVLGLVRVEVI